MTAEVMALIEEKVTEMERRIEDRIEERLSEKMKGVKAEADDEWLTKEQLAMRLGKKPATLSFLFWKMKRENKPVPMAKRVGRRLYYRASAVRSIIDNA